MHATVLFFASIADQVGMRRLEVEVEPGATVGSVRDRLVARYPQIARFVPTLLYAVDEEYARESDTLPPGATLALIPPVSGG
jgi:molybdopterin synthase catalytic subunit